MSMPVIKCCDKPINRCQAINDLIESVALVETGISHIVNAEGEKIQKVVALQCDPTITEDLLKINDSVNKTIMSLTKLEMVLQSKLEVVIELDKNCLC